MGTFSYFGYGSNMLGEWLGQRTRCPSCKAQAVASVEGYALSFDKISIDGSGKATIVKREGSKIFGRVFLIDDVEIGALDAAEGKGSGYDRDDAFSVDLGSTKQLTKTYVGTNLAAAGTGKPYDWYLALVVAGAVQSELPADYVEKLRATPMMGEPPATLSETRRLRLAEKKHEAIAALGAAGFESIEAVLKS